MLSLALAILLAGLTPLAFAEPPDPSCLAGIWDDDDFDNTVTFIVAACAIEALAPTDAGPVAVRVTCLEPARPAGDTSAVRSTRCSRAPPVAASPDC